MGDTKTLEYMNHDLFKQSGMWHCRVCQWQWASKPRTECPECKRYDWGCAPSHLLTIYQLEINNLKPKSYASPSACYHSMTSGYHYLYDKKDCEKANKKLPKIYKWDARDNLKTEGELGKINLGTEGVKPVGVAPIYDSEEKTITWINLYNPSDCHWKAQDKWISKTKLKSSYSLSESWIKRIGEPEKTIQHSKWKTNIYLYSCQKVEAFLAENIEEYCTWLEKYDKCLAVFEKNRAKIEEGKQRYLEQKQAIQNQQKKCLKCASCWVTDNGFFCVIYSNNDIPLGCTDFRAK